MRSSGSSRLERDDRHVLRTRVRLNDRTALHRVRLALSEALRLTELPGEAQGRVYYFRRVALRDVPADGERTVWLERMRHALTASAERAVHGARPGAGTFDGVFFHSHEEALELLLLRLVERAPASEWFWAMAGGADAGAPHGERIVATIERLRDLPASWTRVAQVVFGALESPAIAELAAEIPVAATRSWLRELGDDGTADERAAAIELSPRVLAALEAAAQRFGNDARTLWLATLAMTRALPASAGSGACVAQARALLRRHAATRRDDALDDGASWFQPFDRRPPIAFDDGNSASGVPRGAPRAHAERERERFTVHEPEPPHERASHPARPVDAAARDTDANDADERSGPAGVDANGVRPTRATPRLRSDDAHGERPPDEDAAALRTHVTADDGGANGAPPDGTAFDRFAPGAVTDAAGLLFLLNVLTRLGIAHALDADPALAGAGVPLRVLARLAAHARVAATDPLMPWIEVETVRTAGAFAALRPSAAAWPPPFARPHRGAAAPDGDAERFVRAWSLAVRRACWRAGRLTVPEIVHRRGRLTLSRTDIDISLPLDDADIRIRRAALDVDPGWLLWLGRVVRFHYTRAERSGPAC